MACRHLLGFRAPVRRFGVPFQGLGVLGGSWVVISRVISRVTILITHIRGLMTLLITTHEPPSSFALKEKLRRQACTGLMQLGRPPRANQAVPGHCADWESIQCTDLDSKLSGCG